MSKVKHETVKEAVDRLADVEVPKLMSAIIANTTIDVAERVTQIGMLDTVLHHLKLLQARLE